MTKENPIVIEDREELIYMLSEAASLEHMIMCQYLFATFSVKRDVSEGVTEAQLEAICDRLVKQPGAPQELVTVGANMRKLAVTLAQPLGVMAPNTH